LTDIINLLLGAIMGGACMVVFGRIHDKADSRGDAGFVLFWGIWWWIILIVYALLQFAQAPYWIVQCFDMLGNGSLFIAAYALYKGKEFNFRSPDIVWILVATAILIVLCTLGGLLGPKRTVDWHVFAMAPSQVLATTAFILLGIVGGARFPDFRISIYVLCGIYGILQVPAYHAVFIEPLEHSSRPETADFWKWCLAAGKVAFAIGAAGVLGFLNTRHIKLASAILSLLSVAFGFAIAIVRFITAASP
jgi:hypothetical protein